MSLAKWSKWLQAESLSFDECVALSLGKEPRGRSSITRPTEPAASIPSREEYDAAMARLAAPKPPGHVPATAEQWMRATLADPVSIRWEHPAFTTEEGRERLEMLRECFHAADPMLPPVGDRAALRLRLQDFARFALANGWTVPGKLAELAAEEEPQTPTARPARTVHKLDSKRRNAFTLAAEAVIRDLTAASGVPTSADPVWAELMQKAEAKGSGLRLEPGKGIAYRADDGTLKTVSRKAGGERIRRLLKPDT